jgi:putative ABC transport system permease protein
MKKSVVYSFILGKLYKMALRNIFRDRKRAAVVFISLFLGITTFNTIITIVASMDPDNFVAMFAESDVVLTNNTVFSLYNTVSPKQKFDDNFFELIASSVIHLKNRI